MASATDLGLSVMFPTVRPALVIIVLAAAEDIPCAIVGFITFLAPARTAHWNCHN